MIREFAPAKINLFLHVGDKRGDGFHAVQSLVAFADVGDALTFEPARDLSLSLEGPFAKDLIEERENLVLRAAHTLAAKSGIEAGARIVLTKSIPVASGIGGGSADAAAALRGLGRLWGAPIAERELFDLAASLGSDVPVCLAAVPSWMEGRGERVSPAPPLPHVSLVLVNPRIAVPTAPVFEGLKTRRGVDGAKPGGWATFDELIAYLKTMTNDLEAPAMKIAPSVGVVLGAISGCANVAIARMSGSGATCFGMFRRLEEARAAAAALKRRHADWWIGAAGLTSSTR